MQFEKAVWLPPPLGVYLMYIEDTSCHGTGFCCIEIISKKTDIWLIETIISDQYIGVQIL